MALPEALDTRLTDELAALTPAAPSSAASADAAEPGSAASTDGPHRWRVPSPDAVKRRAKSVARRGLHRAVRRFRSAAAGRELVDPFVVERTDPLAARIAELTSQVAATSAQLATIAADQSQSVADRINLTLLKDDVIAISGRVDEVLAEMREQEQRLLDLGMAFAPGAGLAGAAARFAELREQINSLERRLRLAPAAAALEAPANDLPAAEPAASAPTSAATSAPASAPAGGGPERPATAASTVASELFNYVGFERRFRGDPETILAMQTERYLDLLSGHGPVVDIGCGRAELLEQLQANGVSCIGVDTDSGMVAEGRARGLDIRHTDALTFLEQVEPGSIGSVFSAHVVEHLELDVLIRFLELSARKLAPGGVFVAETPNPASLIVLGNSYIMDPTHVRPLHPSLLAFLCETAGFRDVRLEFFSPATGYQLSTVDSADAPDWVRTLNGNTERLNEVLFGPQEYAVIATTPR